MTPQTLQALPTEITSLILVGLLIAVLVIAYKIMEMVFETVTVAAISGAFYTGLTYLFGGGNLSGFALDEFLLFIFLGASLYLLYTFIRSVYSAANTLIDIPVEMAKILTYPFRKMWKRRKKKKKSQSQKNDEEETKEVVLDKVQDDE